MKYSVARRIGLKVAMLVVVTAAFAMMQGCARPVKGPAFTEIKEIPADRGLVYIYRPLTQTARSMANTVEANGERVFLMHKGGYHPYLAKPGKVEISVRGGGKRCMPVVIDVVPRRTYYVRARVHTSMNSSHWWAPLSLKVVPADIGAKEIAKCNLENN